MKFVIGLLSLIAINSAMADEPSVRQNCKTGFKAYEKANGSRIDSCPDGLDALKLDVTAVGSNYHTCWWPAEAIRVGKDFVATDDDCELTISYKEKAVSAEFVGKCRFHCGARAHFSNGIFEEKPSN